MKIAPREPYSYRGDPAVPGFDDRGPVVFMDGECVLCTRTARLIARLDRRGDFRICSVQSPLGQAMLMHHGLDPGDPDSWLYLVKGKAYGSLDAVIRAGKRLGGWGHAVRVLQILPRPAQDWLYRRIARNRYSVTGRTDMCAIPDESLKGRLLT
jgi:predicted DCC family thiol-disulfide oxidoreductase YuxK